MNNEREKIIRYRPLLWFLIPFAMIAVWNGSYWAFEHFECPTASKSIPACHAGPVNLAVLFAIGWICRLLWFPSLLVCIVLAGLGLQRQVPTALLQRLTVTYEDATALTAKAVAIWVVVTAIGTAGALLATYPNAPSSVAGWLALMAPWMPLWLSFSWVKRKREPRLAARRKTEAAKRHAIEQALGEFTRTRKLQPMGAHILRLDAREAIVRVTFMTDHVPPDRAWYAVSPDGIRELSFDEVAHLESPWR